MRANKPSKHAKKHANKQKVLIGITVIIALAAGYILMTGLEPRPKRKMTTMTQSKSVQSSVTEDEKLLHLTPPSLFPDVDVDTLRDPFHFLSISDSSSDFQDNDLDLSKYKIQGFFGSGKNITAFINDQIYKKGDKLEVWTIESINRNQIILRLKNKTVAWRPEGNVND